MKLHRYVASVLALTAILLVTPKARSAVEEDAKIWQTASRHAERSNEVFVRCHRLMRAWYRHKGHGNHLLPQNLGSRLWTGENSAADLWSFFVLTAYLTDTDALNSYVRQTLIDEIRLTTRVGMLPDAYHIDRNVFAREEINMERVLFGSSEYVKDGLLPIAELMGRTAWFQRSRDLLDGIFAHAAVHTRFGKIPSERAEVNGEMLQNLCRFYSATGDPRYKAWAERIGDAYFLDALPECNGLPCHHWDFSAGKPRSDVLSLSDHGNEILFGLSELMMLEHVYDKAKAKQYLPAMRRMLDTLLKVAVNEDGLWVHSIQPSTGKVLKPNTPDTWGYALDAYYTFYLITGEERYRQAVHRALKGINAKPKYREWGGSDAFADSIESGIVLLNRIPEPEGFAWLEATVPAFLAKQKEDGIVEGWHGDGNYARTALMYALMKTAGTRISTWRKDVKFGAAIKDKSLYVQLTSAEPWQGKLHLDYPRHRMHMGLTMNYPRLNEFPEWYTVEPTRLYDVSINGVDQPAMIGDDLIRGIPIKRGAGKPIRVIVRPVDGPPYGGKAIRIKGPAACGGEGDVKLELSLLNETGRPQKVRLTSEPARVEPAVVDLPAEGKAAITVVVPIRKDGTVLVTAKTADGDYETAHQIRVIHDKNLTGFASYSDQEYKGRGYLWSKRRPIEAKLAAKRGKAHTLHILWGSKGRKRAGVVFVNGKDTLLVHGGYDGFEWVKLPVPAEQVKGDSVEVRILPNERKGAPAFVSEMKLTCP